MMNLEYRSLLPPDFAPDARVWVYQSSRLFTLPEALDIEERLNAFVASWTSHGALVRGYANLFFGQFLVLMADERSTQVSGCSTDSSVRLVKGIEEAFGVQLFDRQTLAFLVKDRVELLPLSQFRYAVDHGFIGPDTLYFHNLVQNRVELDNRWIIPVRESWLATRLPAQTS
jgi:hypothetical protein